MIDANAVVQQARYGTAPATWQVLRANRSFFVVGVFGYLFLIVAAIAGAAYLLLTGTIVGIGVDNPNVSDGWLLLWLVIDMVVLAVLALVGVGMTISRLRGMGTLDDQMLVLMPEGFVMRLGPSEKQTTTVSYQNVATITPTIDSGTYYLKLQMPDGSQTKVEVDGRFGKPKQISEQIQGMHAHFVTVRSGIRQNY